jgi:hypothetical protein
VRRESPRQEVIAPHQQESVSEILGNAPGRIAAGVVQSTILVINLFKSGELE